MRTYLASLLVVAAATSCGGDDGPAVLDAHVKIDSTKPIDAFENHPDSNTPTDGAVIDGAAIDGAVTVDAGIDGSVAVDAAIDGSVTVDAMVDGTTMMTPSQQIAAVRAATDGTVSLPIQNALVTYVAPAIGTDPAGVFVQAEQTGPAIWVAVDTSTLTPAPAIGQNVSFTVTSKATVSMEPRATAITGWAVNTTGNSVTGLVQDLSNTADLNTAAANYDAELSTVTGTVVGAFINSAMLHQAAEFDTMALTGANAPKFRLPTDVENSLDLAAGCKLTVGPTPMIQFATASEPTAWVAGDVHVTSCPMPKLTVAAGTTGTTVLVTFDRKIDPASIMTNGSQFTFTGGLTATAAAAGADAHQVIVTTGTQSATTYTVTVAATLKDTYGDGVDATANSMMFVGFSVPATLLINEVNPNIGSSKDLVELLATSGGTINGFTLVQNVSGSVLLATLPNLTVATGDLIVIHLGTVTSTSETATKGDCTDATCYPGAWDVNGGTTGITYSNRVLRLIKPDATIADALPLLSSTTANSPQTFNTELAAIQTAAGGGWMPSDCGGAACSTTSTPTMWAVSIDASTVQTTATGISVQRKAGANTHSNADWTAAASTFGASN